MSRLVKFHNVVIDVTRLIMVNFTQDPDGNDVASVLSEPYEKAIEPTTSKYGGNEAYYLARWVASKAAQELGFRRYANTIIATNRVCGAALVADDHSVTVHLTVSTGLRPLESVLGKEAGALFWRQFVSKLPSADTE